jgi:hypothetical protein
MPISDNEQVVGVTFEGRQEIIKTMPTENIQLELKPEPTNPYDRWAIQVIFDGKVIGYFAKKLAENLHRNYLDLGITLVLYLRQIHENDVGILVPIVEIFQEIPNELVKNQQEQEAKEQEDKTQVEEILKDWHV